MNSNKIAFMYDFDETLSYGYMQDHSLIPLLGFDVKTFWKEVNDFGKANNMDNVLAYMYKIVEQANKKNIDISKEKMLELGKGLRYFDGVLTWFDRINDFGKSLGLEIEHYIISSGMKEIIEGTEIVDKFKKIFACSYVYDEKGNPIWPCIAVNYTNKTQYVYRIRKNRLEDLNNTVGVNDFVEEENKLPYKNMFYFGDGMTDIPAMKLLKSKGGHAFAVFSPNSEKAKRTSIKLFDEKRVDYIALADYREGMQLDTLVKGILKTRAEEIKNNNVVRTIVEDAKK